MSGKAAGIKKKFFNNQNQFYKSWGSLVWRGLGLEFWENWGFVGWEEIRVGVGVRVGGYGLG